MVAGSRTQYHKHKRCTRLRGYVEEISLFEVLAVRTVLAVLTLSDSSELLASNKR